MKGMMLYIILGVLVGAVIIFLVVSTVLDKKKNKKLKALKAEEDKEREAAAGNVAFLMIELIAANKKMINNFVPSVGQYKMSDIKNNAKKAINTIESSRDFKLIKIDSDNKVLPLIKNFKKTSSNTWEKKLKSDINNLTKIMKSELKADATKKKQLKKVIDEVYK